MIRILHISDLHASPSRIEDLRAVLRAMLDDAVAFGVEKPIDLVVISGDLVKRGKASEFNLVVELLIKPLRTRLGLNPSQIVVAPGNHDLDQEAISALVEKGLVHDLTGREQVNALLDSKRDLDEAVERFASWDAFHRDHYGDEPPLKPGPLAFVHRFVCDGRSVGVAALNSAWRSSGHAGERGKLLLGARQVECALDAIAETELRVIVMHHPLSWLAPFDAEHVQAEFENRGVIVLSGHEHKAEPAIRRSPYGEVLQLSTGSLYLNREHPNGFQIVDVDLDDQKVVTHLRSWQRRRGVFDADLNAAENGREEFDLPTADRRRKLGHPRFSAVMRGLAEEALSLVPEELVPTAPPSASMDVLIKPRFLKIPPEEAEAKATLGGEIAPDETDPLDHDDEGPAVVLLVGPPEAGRTTALLQMLADAYRRDIARMPAFMRARDSGLGTAKEAATLAKASTRFGYRRSAAGDPDLNLGIDDFAQVSPRRQDLNVEFMRTNPRHRYFLVCDEEWADGVAARLEAAGVSYVLVFLAPLDSRQVRELGRAMRSAPSDVERVDAIMSKQQLPRNPPTAIALLALQAGRRDAESDLSEHALLGAYVDLLLDRAQRKEAEQLDIGPDQRTHLLGELARILDEAPGRSRSEIEIEEAIAGHFATRGIDKAANRVLGMLLASSILRVRNEQVSFRYPTVFNFFLGRWMLEDSEHKRAMLADCGMNAEAIRHAAGVRRGDRDILASAKANAKAAIADTEPFMTPERVDEMLATLETTGCWKAEKLGRALALLPSRHIVAEIDARGDRIPSVLSRQCTVLARPWFEVTRRLNEAISLLSDVLRSSELLDDVPLKREAFETAITGWLVLIGLLIAEDPGGELFRGPIDDFVADGLDDRPSGKHQQVPRGIAVAAVLFVVTISMQGRLGCRNLSKTIESCLANESLESPTARGLATWLLASIGTAGWHRRLKELLDTMPIESLLRDGTLMTAAHLYRASPLEPEVRELESILVESIAPASERGPLVAHRRERQRQQVAKRLRQVRRGYQHRPPEQVAYAA